MIGLKLNFDYNSQFNKALTPISAINKKKKLYH